jgi:hypothetical protein
VVLKQDTHFLQPFSSDFKLIIHFYFNVLNSQRNIQLQIQHRRFDDINKDISCRRVVSLIQFRTKLMKWDVCYSMHSDIALQHDWKFVVVLQNCQFAGSCARFIRGLSQKCTQRMRSPLHGPARFSFCALVVWVHLNKSLCRHCLELLKWTTFRHVKSLMDQRSYIKIETLRGGMCEHDCHPRWWGREFVAVLSNGITIIIWILMSQCSGTRPSLEYCSYP